MTKRKLGEAHKKIVAARQRWACSTCEQILSAAYQVDHTVPLWEGGADSVDNMTALCASCHAVKTQEEAIRRSEHRRRTLADKAALAQRDFESGVRAEEYASRTVTPDGEGKCMCSECGERFYAIFKHTTCPTVEERIESRINPAAAKRVAKARKTDHECEGDNPFLRFLYIKSGP